MRAEQDTKQEQTDRWRMGRVGILNFWYYDEEVFELEEGRMILRGSNGSGKSVTMQSFLPLVLDGDKRPHRLDPFGSRDRRIEFYLLGEADSGKTDVTGYLWMEFVHPERGLTKTIGIGLRARRGAQSVQFWGFLLDDGRRMGENFWLYDRNYWLEHHTRVPLSRQELERAIGVGGQVVQDQGSYRDMVNKHLFGFADAEAFQDLLHLLIQLRSPKLSKDFKPTAIYEILQGSLPPLQEDDLRPLSEVLEDMDQIADRLDELRLHTKEMGRLQEVYDRYNKRTIYDESVNILDKNSEYVEVHRKTVEHATLLEEAKVAQEAAEVEIARMDAAISQAAAELDILDKHEAIGKQRELEAATSALTEQQKHLELAKDRVSKQRRNLDTVVRALEDEKYKREKYSTEQREILDDLEGISQDIEFAAHPVYHQYWDRSEPVDDRWKEPWRRDLRQHRERIELALGKSREEREASRLVQELEIELGEVRKERDERERERGEQARILDEDREELRESIVSWQSTLQELLFHDEYVRESFAAISAFGPDARATDPVRAPMLRLLNEHRETLANERLQLQHQKKNLELEKQQLEELKQTWETSREPEPARSEARIRERMLRKEGEGAPLYAVCDFQAHIDEQQQAQIEEALERSGLLDAWISADGYVGAIGSVAADHDEVWIVPQPNEIGYTLADILTPVHAENTGLTADKINAILRTFLWMEEGDAADFDAFGAVVSGNGAFRIGPLVGATGGKQRAEYIGKETRKRTRLLEIARLQQKIDELKKALDELGLSISILIERDQRVKVEGDSFPSCGELEHSLQSLLEVTYRLEAALKQETRVLERYKEKHALWRDLQWQVSELTADWTRLKREKELQEAAASTRDYESSVGDLHSAWSRGYEAAERIARSVGEQEAIEDSIENDQQLIDELDEHARNLRAKVEALRKLMKEMGLEDISNRIEELKREQEQLLREKKLASTAFGEAGQAAARAEASVQLYQEQENERHSQLKQAFLNWHQELQRGLVMEWRDVYDRDAEQQEIIRLSQEIRQRFDAQFESKGADSLKNKLLEQYNEVRSILTDYVLESDIEEASGRIIILSKRDRLHPQPPLVLLEELRRDELEQSSLLSVKDKELYEEIILRSVGKAIRGRIHRAENWVKQMNRLMEERNTSSGLRLKLDWIPRAAQNEQQIDTGTLVELLKRDSHRLREDEIDDMIQHFRSQIGYAKQSAQSEKESLRKHLYEVLDYRNWFQFELKYKKGEQQGYRPLTDSRFNVLSGGEKAMAMYIPLFAATWSRYSDARADAPRLISLDEAFAGVDEENMRDMFDLLTDMGFDYMMTSQVLWGCYDTVPKLAIYEIYRPKDVDFVTLFRYRWNGRMKEYVNTDGENG